MGVRLGFRSGLACEGSERVHRRESALLAGAVLADPTASPPPPPPGAAASGVGPRMGLVRVGVVRMGVRLSFSR